MNILVIGGSLIGDGGIIESIRHLFLSWQSASCGIDSVLVRQATLADHFDVFGSRALLFHRQYDAVILQEKGVHPLDNFAACKDYAKRWQETILDRGAQGYLLLPWRRVEHFGQEDKFCLLTERYCEIARSASLKLIPAGFVWTQLAVKHRLNLYQSVGNHANACGAESTALTVLFSMFPDANDASFKVELSPLVYRNVKRFFKAGCGLEAQQR